MKAERPQVPQLNRLMDAVCIPFDDPNYPYLCIDCTDHFWHAGIASIYRLAFIHLMHADMHHTNISQLASLKRTLSPGASSDALRMPLIFNGSSALDASWEVRNESTVHHLRIQDSYILSWIIQHFIV
jgi:hypothetical protein